MVYLEKVKMNNYEKKYSDFGQAQDLLNTYNKTISQEKL